MKTAEHRLTLSTPVPSKKGLYSSSKQNKVRRLTNISSMATSKNKSPDLHISQENSHHYNIPTSNTPDVSPPGQIKVLSDPAVGNEQGAIVNHAQDRSTTGISRSIETHAPMWTVYDTWTRFEAFPHFMKGMDDEHGRLDESRMVWRIRTGNVHVPLEAEVYLQIPFHKIAWRSISGHPHPNSGEVIFDAVNEHVTQITAHFDFSAPCAHEWPDDPIPAVTKCLDWSLRCFCSVVESHVDPECESFVAMKLQSHERCYA